MLNVDHQVTDGIGIRIILGRYLASLAAALDRQDDFTDERIDWRESWKNMSPAWVSIMNEEQLLSGPGYERIAEMNRDIIFNKLVRLFVSGKLYSRCLELCLFTL